MPESGENVNYRKDPVMNRRERLVRNSPARRSAMRDSALPSLRYGRTVVGRVLETGETAEGLTATVRIDDPALARALSYDTPLSYAEAEQVLSAQRMRESQALVDWQWRLDQLASRAQVASPEGDYAWTAFAASGAHTAWLGFKAGLEAAARFPRSEAW